jgi:glucose-1-phosphate adenylyltransferase
VDRYNTIDAGDRLGYDLDLDRSRHHVSASGIVVVAKAPFRAETRRHW